MLDQIRQKLRVRGRSRATAVNVFRQLRNLVTDAIGDIGTRRNARIRTQNNTITARHGHDGRPGTDFAVFQVVVAVIVIIAVAAAAGH